MARKKRIKREEILMAVLAVAAVIIIASGGISITGDAAGVKSISDEQCYKRAAGIDNSVENVATEYYYSGQSLNPCTGTMMNYDSYIDSKMGGFYRTVFENGDIRGHKMLTSYIVCSDGRAMIYSRLGAYYFNRGNNPWGFWLFNPHLANQYKIEKCDTI